MDLDLLTRAPFNLDAAGISWVERTLAGLSPDRKIAQIMVAATPDQSQPALDRLLASGAGGIHRFGGDVATLRESAAYLQSRSDLPLLLSADIEFSETASFPDGTALPNQMGVAATGDPVWASRAGTIAAREGGYRGFNWSFTPVADLSLNRRNPAVNTRSFGSDPELVAAFASAAITAMQAGGMASGVKHFPGDGVDDRDQHFVTTRNSLDMAAWRLSYGRVFAAAIAAGARSIMAGHITLPAYAAELGVKARSPAELPASLNADLNFGLLRGELGFNGLILSDSTGMAGFNNRGRREDLVPLCIENGCDVLLFQRDFAADHATLQRALGDGRLSAARLDEAVLRLLALKASLNLHRTRELPAEADPAKWSAEHAVWARGVAEASVTLVRDDQKLLPLSPEKHRRLLLVEQRERRSIMRPLLRLIVADRLRRAGFAVTEYAPGQSVSTADHDAALYLIAIEGTSAKLALHVPWDELHGLFPASMTRLWQHLPTAFVSFGTPYHIYEAPDCLTFVNAYSPVVPVQEAVVKALTGQIAFAGKSPVDPFSGLA